MTGEQADALYGAGGTDCSPGVLNGRPYIAFDREADTLANAMRSAFDLVESLGYVIIQIDME